MNKEDYEYFIAESYSVLLPEDIEKYGIAFFLQTHFNIHYIYDSFTFILTDDGTNSIIKNLTKTYQLVKKVNMIYPPKLLIILMVSLFSFITRMLTPLVDLLKHCTIIP